MITRVSVRGFRSLEDMDVSLGPLTVLVGKNGSGKSNFLDLLRFVRDAVNLGLDRALIDRQGITRVRTWSSRRPRDLVISLETMSGEYWGQYEFSVKSDPGGNFRIGTERCRIGDGIEEADDSFHVEGGAWKVIPNNPLFAHHQGEREQDGVSGLSLNALTRFASTPLAALSHDLRMGGFYELRPSIIRNSRDPLNEEYLEDDGKNFASVLRRLLRIKTFDRQGLVASLRQVVGEISDIRVVLAGGNLVTALKHGDLDGNGPWFNLAQESDGTVRMLALLIALSQDPIPPLIAIEEPELHVHPGALGALCDVLREAALRTQLLITTQSPDLIARFRAEELRIVEKTSKGTEIGPLSESQRAAIHEQLFSAGDLLRIEGLAREPLEPAAAGHA